MRLTLLQFFSFLLIFPGIISAQCDNSFADSNINDATIYLSTTKLAGLYNYRLGSFINSGAGLNAVTSPNTIPNKPVLFANNIWFAAQGQDQVQYLAASTFAGFSDEYPFVPGPLDLAGNGITLENGCINYDRPWLVDGDEIQRHLQDWMMDQDIDAPIPAIMAWPGKGNPHFAEIHGFDLPDNSLAMAPFWDFNQDGIYNPLDGDYPWVQQGEEAAIPYRIIWSVVNDVTDPIVDGSTNFNAQVGITTWYYECDKESVVEGVIFTRYTLTNYAQENYLNLRFGIWTDFDLGCVIDDRVGSAPDNQSFYVYNADLSDGDETGNCFFAASEVFQEAPPIFSINYLDQDLDAFVVFQNTAPIDNALPATGPQYYNALQGLRTDGSPFTLEFNGTDETTIIFPDTPFLNNGWVMDDFPDFIPFQDFDCLASSNLGDWSPEQILEVTIAYQLHEFNEIGPLSNNFINMYEQQSTLLNWYEMEEACNLKPACEDDCVWAGDTDANGKVDHFDFLPISTARDLSGPVRDAPIDWSPRSATTWSSDLSNGRNYKHIDADGDGTVEQLEDWEVSLLNFGRTNFNYELLAPVYPLGDDFFFQVLFSNYDPANASPGDNLVLALKLNESLANLRAVAFNLEYDQSFIESIEPVENQLPDNYFFIDETNDGLLEIAIAAKGEEVLIDNGPGIFVFSISLQDEIIEPALSAITNLRLQNLSGIDPNGNYLDLGYQDFTFTFPDIMVNTEEELLAAGVNIYPNPAEEMVNIQIQDMAIQSLRLFQFDGKQLLHQTMVNDGEQNIQLDLNSYPQGIYLLVFKDHSGKKFTKRVVKF